MPSSACSRLPFDEEHGGFGGGAVETMIVMEAFGKALVLEPYFATVVLAGGILRHGASDVQKAELIPAIADGKHETRLRPFRARSRAMISSMSSTSAKKDGDGCVLDGAKRLVLHGDSADKIIVSARIGGGMRGTRPASACSWSTPAHPVYPAAAIRPRTACAPPRSRSRTFVSRRSDVIGDPAGAFAVIARVADEAIAALCAEAVGAMEEMHEITVDYLKTRKQFGTTIGSFQALQHRAVDMLRRARTVALAWPCSPR